MLSSRFLKVKPHLANAVVKGSKDSGFYHFLDLRYTRMLEWSMSHRWIIVSLSVLVSLSTIPLGMLVGKNFVPQDDRSEFAINVRAPEGTTIAATLTVAERVARELRALPEVETTLTTIGQSTGGFGNIAVGSANRANIYIRLKPVDQRKLSQPQMMLKARELLKTYPPELKFAVVQAGGPTGGQADVQFSLSGPDLDQLNKYSGQLMAKAREIPYIADVDSSLVFGKPELRVEIDRQRAADLGVRVSDIATALNTLIAGQVVSTFPAAGEEYDVRLRAYTAFRTRVEALAELTVATNRGGWIPLDQVVHLKPDTAPSSIGRIDRQRQVQISANVLPGGSQGVIIQQLNAKAGELSLAPGYSTGLQGTSKELGRAAYFFVLAFALTFIFMYIVLAAQFESFIHPLTILLTLPIAIPFGILSLLLTGQTINIFSALGMLLLFGIVKKNAILQIDHTNGLRASGMNLYDAIIQANRDRLRPILMTTTALIAGMMPLVLSTGDGAATNRSIGVLVVGGQALCLLLTLLAVPVFYSIFDDMSRMRIFRRFAQPVPLPSGDHA